MDFILDPSLVLYLPLYEPDGASLVSKEKHGHLATVTGALWRPQGRDFDGVDDKISLPYSAAYDVITELTALAWLKPDALNGAGATAISRDQGSSPRLWKFGYYQNGFYYQVWGAGNGDFIYPPAIPTYTVGNWFYSGFTFKQGEYRSFFVNGERVHTMAATGSLLQGTAVGLTVGSTWPGGEWYNGLIGEVYIYSRALSALEIQQNYLATKWRYQ